MGSANRLLHYAIRYYGHYKAGFLPRVGGICDQNAMLMGVFSEFLTAEGTVQRKAEVKRNREDAAEQAKKKMHAGIGDSNVFCNEHINDRRTT